MDCPSGSGGELTLTVSRFGFTPVSMATAVSADRVRVLAVHAQFVM